MGQQTNLGKNTISLAEITSKTNNSILHKTHFQQQ